MSRSRSSSVEASSHQARVLEAAARLLERGGPDALTMQALSEATGLSRATIYRCTGGREGLLDRLAAQGAAVGDRSDSRERILAAARTVFSRTGFEGATIEEIAREADVGLATVYRTFGDREGLVAAFLSELAPRRAASEGAARPSDDLRADLTRVAERMLQGLRDDGAVMRLMLLEGLRGGPFIHRVRAVSPTRTLPSIIKLLATHARAGRLPGHDLEFLAQSFSGLVMAFGVLGPIVGDRPMGDPAATARAVTSLFLDGARAPSPPPRKGRPHARARRR